jgi:hypothetical protein
MSLAISVGFFTAYPTNWWLVSKGLKHGLMTVRRGDDRESQDHSAAMPAHQPGHA